RQMAATYDESIKAATYARNLSPNNTRCYLLLAQAQANSGKNEEAAITLCQALQLQAMQSYIWSEANQQLWDSLRKMYTSFGQSDAFVLAQPDPANPTKPDVPRYQPNLRNPVLARHFNAAGAGIVQLMLDAKDYANAEIIRAYAIANFGIPESQMPHVPPVPPKSKFFDKIGKKLSAIF
ncbi:MAG: hypothetical protein WCL04_08365, partial [Verrucomicrobiota bacterium]